MSDVEAQVNNYNNGGYDKDSFDVNGFNRQDYDRAGYDRARYSRLGFDRNGFDARWNCINHIVLIPKLRSGLCMASLGKK